MFVEVINASQWLLPKVQSKFKKSSSIQHLLSKQQTSILQKHTLLIKVDTHINYLFPLLKEEIPV